VEFNRKVKVEFLLQDLKLLLFQLQLILKIAPSKYTQAGQKKQPTLMKRNVSNAGRLGKTHHHLLHKLNEDLKEQIWNDNSFWPF